MKASALYLVMIALPTPRALSTGAEDADRHARRKAGVGVKVASSSHSSTDSRRLARQVAPDTVRRLRPDAAWPAGPGTHLRPQLVHHAKVHANPNPTLALATLGEVA